MFPHLPPIVAHIVGERPPSLFSWLVALGCGAAGIGALLTRARARRVLVALAVVALGATVWDMYARGVRPARPDLSIRLVLPRVTTTRPVAIEACGSTRAGRTVSPTAGGRWLLIRVDGAQVAEVHQSRLILPMAVGHHLLFVEVNSPYHQEFVPPVTITRTINVVHAGGTVTFPRCTEH